MRVSSDYGLPGSTVASHPAPLYWQGGRKIATLGDSLLDDNDSVIPVVGFSTTHVQRSTGFLNWARWLGLDFDHDNWYDPRDPLGRGYVGASFGVFGSTTGQIASRARLAMATTPDWIIVSAGGNDTNDNLPVEQTVANLTGLLDFLADTGVGVVVIPNRPRTAAGWPDDEANLAARRRWRMNKVNDALETWYEQNVGRCRVLWFDFLDDWQDYTASGLAVPKTTSARDAIHFTPAMAGLAGARLKNLLLPFMPRRRRFLTSTDDFYDATYRPFGAINANPWLEGTNGVLVAGKGITGTLAGGSTTPARFVLDRSNPGASAAGTECVASIATSAEGIREQVLTFTPTEGTGGDANTPFHRFLFRIGTGSNPTADIAVPAGVKGGWVRSQCRVRLSDGAAFGAAELTLRGGLATSTITIVAQTRAGEGWSFDPSGDVTADYFPYPTGELDLLVTTPAMYVPLDCGFLRPELVLRVDSRFVGAPVAYISGFAVKPVADPRPRWNYPAP